MSKSAFEILLELEKTIIEDCKIKLESSEAVQEIATKMCAEEIEKTDAFFSTDSKISSTFFYLGSEYGDKKFNLIDMARTEVKETLANGESHDLKHIQTIIDDFKSCVLIFEEGLEKIKKRDYE